LEAFRFLSLLYAAKINPDPERTGCAETFFTVEFFLNAFGKYKVKVASLTESIAPNASPIGVSFNFQRLPCRFSPKQSHYQNFFLPLLAPLR